MDRVVVGLSAFVVGAVLAWVLTRRAIRGSLTWKATTPRTWDFETVLQILAFVAILAIAGVSVTESRLEIDVNSNTVVLMVLLALVSALSRLESISFGGLTGKLGKKLRNLREEVGAGDEAEDPLTSIADTGVGKAYEKLAVKLEELAAEFVPDWDPLSATTPHDHVTTLETAGLLAAAEAKRTHETLDLLEAGRSKDASADDVDQALKLQEALTGKLRTWVLDAAARLAGEKTGWEVTTIPDAKRQARKWSPDLLFTHPETGAKVLVAPKAATLKKSSLLQGALKRVDGDFEARAEQLDLAENGALVVISDDSASAPKDRAFPPVVKLSDLPASLEAIAAGQAPTAALDPVGN